MSDYFTKAQKLSMNNQEKERLAQIVKSIPKEAIERMELPYLWKEYAPDFKYGTFRDYFKTFRT